MKESALIVVQLRLDTAAMALRSAVAEIAQPANERNAMLMEHLLDALREAELAQEMCKVRLRVVQELAP